MKYEDIEIIAKDITRYNASFRDYPILVCDTETINGIPYTIQFFDGSGEAELYYVNAETILDCFLDRVERDFRPNLTVWFFYLPFDAPIIHIKKQELFTHDTHKQWIGQHFFDYVTAKVWFANCEWQKNKWMIRDAFQFLHRGLEKSAVDLGLDIGKLKRPDWLGERAPENAEEKEYFEKYAKQDVYVLFKIVHWIIDLHRRFDVGLSVSLADLCGKIMRKKFIRNCDRIELPDSDLMRASLNSYHGGKTECYIPTPCYVNNIYEYDLTSAYPYAMITMPNFFNFNVKRVNNIMLKNIKEDGLYKISGSFTCAYKPCYNHFFKFEKDVRHIWVTSYELLSALELGCFQGTIEEGYEIESDREMYNGIKNYVLEFFEKKAKAKAEGNKTEELINKLALNGLYGKFIARVEEEMNFQETWRAGVLFNPLMATCVTGKLRGLIHSLEHKMKSLHTSTDSFITLDSNGENYFKGIDGIGALRYEYQGDCLIYRRKMYIIISGHDKKCPHIFEEIFSNNSISFVCKLCQGKVVKAALHGFLGNVAGLWGMYKKRKTMYRTNRMIKLRQAFISRDPDMIPFMMQQKIRSLNINWENLITI
jgi:hypothetical protein